jgi:hypothetical protein
LKGKKGIFLNYWGLFKQLLSNIKTMMNGPCQHDYVEFNKQNKSNGNGKFSITLIRNIGWNFITNWALKSKPFLTHEQKDSRHML